MKKLKLKLSKGLFNFVQGGEVLGERPSGVEVKVCDVAEAAVVVVVVLEVAAAVVLKLQHWHFN